MQATSTWTIGCQRHYTCSPMQAPPEALAWPACSSMDKHVAMLGSCCFFCHTRLVVIEPSRRSWLADAGQGGVAGLVCMQHSSAGNARHRTLHRVHMLVSVVPACQRHQAGIKFGCCGDLGTCKLQARHQQHAQKPGAAQRTNGNGLRAGSACALCICTALRSGSACHGAREAQSGPGALYWVGSTQG
jgi:hypothetical protein